MEELRCCRLTANPFLKAFPSTQDSPEWAVPVGPAPAIKAKDRKTMKMNRMILTRDPKPCSQPKALLGNRNTIRQMTRNMVTANCVSLVVNGMDLRMTNAMQPAVQHPLPRSPRARRRMLLPRQIPPSILHAQRLVYSQSRGWLQSGLNSPSHSAKPAAKARAGSTHLAA